jgi:hypothetical protein
MKLVRKTAALCAVFLLSLCFFCTVAYAEETPAPAPTESAAPAESETEAIPPDGTGAEDDGGIPVETADPIPTDEPVIAAIPDGTGTVIEAVTGEDGRKFYTITTPAGNVFYLVIDFTRQADNVYFLDAVTEKDLIALAEKSGDETTGGSVSAIPDPNSADPAPEPTPNMQTDPEAEAPSSNGMSSMILVVAVVVIGGGTAFYFKVYRKKKNADIRDEYEDNEPEAYPADEYETDDDSPPWEDADDTDYGEDDEA